MRRQGGIAWRKLEQARPQGWPKGRQPGGARPNVPPSKSGTSYVESREVPALDDFALCAQVIEAGMTGGNLCWPVSPPEKGQKLRHHLVPSLVHQPVARPLDDHAFDGFGDQAPLGDQELARCLFASQHEHWHLELGRGQAGEVLGVLLERAEYLEAGAHAAA